MNVKTEIQVKNQLTGKITPGYIHYQPGVYNEWARKLNLRTARELRNTKKSRYQHIQEE